MTSTNGRRPVGEPRRRWGIRSQWASYADLPPLERWTRRASMVVGMGIAAALLLLCCRVGVGVYRAVWQAVPW
jgi:hypothetical protein